MWLISICYAFFVAAIGNCQKEKHQGLACTNENFCKLDEREKKLRFFVVGDAGGLPIYPYFSLPQNAVAKTMREMKIEPKFILNLGDNFYYTGVENEFDDRFRKTFEQVYDGQSLQKPWYTVAGNHDYYGNITGQLAYTRHSSRWTFPSTYYKFSYQFGSSLVEFLVIDTIMLCGNVLDIENSGFLEMVWATITSSGTPMEPKDPIAAENQWKWLEEQLENSRADYLFVAGHYPIYSVGESGNTQCLVDRLDPLLYKYNVTAYLAGHDHNLQHLTLPDKNLHYVISGAASRVDRSMKNAANVPANSLHFAYPEYRWWYTIIQLGLSTGGFIMGELEEDKGNFRFISGSGEEIYCFEMSPRKSI